LGTQSKPQRGEILESGGHLVDVNLKDREAGRLFLVFWLFAEDRVYGRRDGQRRFGVWILTNEDDRRIDIEETNQPRLGGERKYECLHRRRKVHCWPVTDHGCIHGRVRWDSFYYIFPINRGSVAQVEPELACKRGRPPKVVGNDSMIGFEFTHCKIIPI